MENLAFRLLWRKTLFLMNPKLEGFEELRELVKMMTAKPPVLLLVEERKFADGRPVEPLEKVTVTSPDSDFGYEFRKFTGDDPHYEMRRVSLSK